MSYGSSKVSSSGSSSFLSGSGSSGLSGGGSSSGSHSGGGGGGSSSFLSGSGSGSHSGGGGSTSSGSCACDFLIEVELLTSDSFVFFVTNMADCDLVITEINYASGGSVTTSVGLPKPVSGGGGIESFPVSETFDVRGKIVNVVTDHCGIAPFEVPLS